MTRRSWCVEGGRSAEHRAVRLKSGESLREAAIARVQELEAGVVRARSASPRTDRARTAAAVGVLAQRAARPAE